MVSIGLTHQEGPSLAVQLAHGGLERELQPHVKVLSWMRKCLLVGELPVT